MVLSLLVTCQAPLLQMFAEVCLRHCSCLCLWLCWPVACATAKSLQSCSTLCDPIDGIPPGCPVPGILQARTLEWVAISLKLFSCVQLFATPWTVAHRAPPSMGFSRQEYSSGLPLPSPVEGPSITKARGFMKNITDHYGMATHQSEWMLVLHRLDADQMDVSPGHSYALFRMLAMPHPVSFYSFITMQRIR